MYLHSDGTMGRAVGRGMGGEGKGLEEGNRVVRVHVVAITGLSPAVSSVPLTALLPPSFLFFSFLLGLVYLACARTHTHTHTHR